MIHSLLYVYCLFDYLLHCLISFFSLLLFFIVFYDSLCYCLLLFFCIFFFFFKQKTAYEMRISDWSSDVCSSDLVARHEEEIMFDRGRGEESVDDWRSLPGPALDVARDHAPAENDGVIDREQPVTETVRERIARGHITGAIRVIGRSEEHTSELQFLMRISYAVFGLKKKITPQGFVVSLRALCRACTWRQRKSITLQF